eukprot:scaffold36090_cov140-Isochrysis_galbana.AAC.3
MEGLLLGLLLWPVAISNRLVGRTTCAATVPRATSAQMRSWTKADMRSASLRLPDEVESLLSADTDRKTTSQLWAAFSTCYATEEDAIAAAKRNTGTILPYLNSPSNIYGSFAYIEQELGIDAAREVCRQNPGVLQCDPRAICQTSGADIARAAKAVDTVESLKLPPGVRMAHGCPALAVPAHVAPWADTPALHALAGAE